MKCDPIDIEVPLEIVQAAYKVAEWAEKNGSGYYWEIGPVCDRNFAMAPRKRTEEQQRLDRLRYWVERGERVCEPPEFFPWRYTEDWKPLLPGDPGYDTAVYETVILKEISGTTPCPPHPLSASAAPTRRASIASYAGCSFRRNASAILSGPPDSATTPARRPARPVGPARSNSATN